MATVLGDYRVRVTSSEAAANGDVFLDCDVERCTSLGPPEEWVLIQMGHRTLVLPGTEILAATSTGTAAQKKAALAALFREKVKEWGLDQSDLAKLTLDSLIVYPVVVSLK